MNTVIDFKTIMFHPSALGNIMSGVKKNWDVDHSLTCKRELIKIFRQIRYDRYYDHSSKYTEKGKKMEEDAITLYSRFRKQVYKKNEQRLTNDSFTGEPDIISEDETIDTKCSWSLDSFPSLLTDPIDADYEYQGLGYMDLTGKRKHTIAYCLVNAPGGLVNKAKDDLFWRLDCPLPTDDGLMKGRIAIEKQMIFDMPQFILDNPDFHVDCDDWTFDIPVEERIIEYTINFDQSKLDAIKSRIKDCRDWMSNNLTV